MGCGALALGILLAFPAAGWAADSPNVPSGFMTLLTGQDHRTALLQAAQQVTASDGTGCKDAQFATTGEVGFLQPLKQDARGQIMGGAWKESITETGCGSPRLLNALTVVQPNGTLQTTPLLPGTTITDPQLQQDSVQYAAAGLGGMPPGCQQGFIVDTQFVGVDGAPPGTRPEPGGVPKPWTENWTVQACAKKAVVGMHFAPDATGTAIRSSPPQQ